ncbi:MAG: hypothetical protein ACT4PP_16400 [Sporichthyaceae bacterium]
MFIRSAALRRVSLTVVPALALAGLGMLSATAAHAADGLMLLPATGNELQNLSLSSPACPANAEGFVVTLDGGPFTGLGANLVAANDLPDGPGTGLSSYQVGASWSSVGQGLPATLSGTGTLSMICTGGDAATFDATVVFTPGAASGQYTYAQMLPPPPSFTLTPDGAPGVIAPNPGGGAPVGTSITVPSGATGGPVFVEQRPVGSDAPPAGNRPAKHAVVPFVVDIDTTAAGTPAAPLQFAFTVPGTLLASSTVAVYRNGALVPDCGTPSLTLAPAGPIACVISRVANPTSGDVVLTIKTLAASVWSFSQLVAEAPPSNGSSGAQNITVVVPETEECQDFVWSIIGADNNVLMSTAVNAGDVLQSTGSLRPITVTDCRDTDNEWAVTGQLQEVFENSEDEDATFSGSYLGWFPQLVNQGAGGALGLNVLPGGAPSLNQFGTGLTSSRALAYGVDGHAQFPQTGQFGAALELRIPFDLFDPANTAALPFGAYASVLTLTALT